MWSFLWALCLLLRVAVAINITVPDPVIFNQTTLVNWSRDDGDPKDWDFRLVNDTSSDYGLVMANVRSDDETFGDTNIIIREFRNGTFRLAAVAKAQDNHHKFALFGYSNWFTVHASAIVSPGAATSVTVGPPTESSTPTNSIPDGSTPASLPNTPVAAATQSSSSSRIPVIVGATVGFSVFIFIAIGLYIFIRRRPRRAKTQSKIIFNRELMFQRRPSPYDSWTSRSVDVEKGSLSDTPVVFVTKTTTRDEL